MKIAIFTSTRAEYGLLKVLIRKLTDDKNFELNKYLQSNFSIKCENIVLKTIASFDGISATFVFVPLLPPPPISNIDGATLSTAT